MFGLPAILVFLPGVPVLPGFYRAIVVGKSADAVPFF